MPRAVTSTASTTARFVGFLALMALTAPLANTLGALAAPFLGNVSRGLLFHALITFLTWRLIKAASRLVRSRPTKPSPEPETARAPQAETETAPEGEVVTPAKPKRARAPRPVAQSQVVLGEADTQEFAPVAPEPETVRVAPSLAPVFSAR